MFPPKDKVTGQHDPSDLVLMIDKDVDCFVSTQFGPDSNFS